MAQSNDGTDRVLSRASVSRRKQRAGAKFTGGEGTKTGESDLLFLEGQLPTVDGKVDTDNSAAEQMERCLVNLRAALDSHNRTLDDVLRVTVYLTNLGRYESVDEVYRDAFDERLPARAVVGVSELLGCAAI